MANIDFNALWDRAYAPVIKTLDTNRSAPIRTVARMIITQMIERLYFADLVLADMTIPNGNVYYEVGVRHAAKNIGCVLLAADWSKALFDIAQMRTLRYPLLEGSIAETTAENDPDGDQGSDRKSWARHFPDLRIDPRIPHRSESGGGDLDEASDGGPCRVSGRNPGRARCVAGRPHGARQATCREILEAAGHGSD